MLSLGMVKDEKMKLRKISTAITSLATNHRKLPSVSSFGSSALVAGEFVSSACSVMRGSQSSSSSLVAGAQPSKDFARHDHRSRAWTRLDTLPRPTLGELFSAVRDGGEGTDEPGGAERVAMLSGRIELGEGAEAGGILFDWSKTHLDRAVIAGFEQLAEAMDLLACAPAVRRRGGQPDRRPRRRPRDAARHGR